MFLLGCMNCSKTHEMFITLLNPCHYMCQISNTPVNVGYVKFEVKMYWLVKVGFPINNTIPHLSKSDLLNFSYYPSDIRGLRDG